MLVYKGYQGAAEADEGAFSGRVIGLGDVITFAALTLADAETAFRDSIDDYLAFCAARGERPEKPQAWATEPPIAW